MGPSSFANSTSTLGFQGCGADYDLSDCGITPTLNVTRGGVYSVLDSDSNALGYAADMPTRADPSLATIIPFLGVGQVAGNTTGGFEYGAVEPTEGTNGSIARGIEAANGTNVSGPAYVGWVPFNWVTADIPLGVVERFEQFVLAPANNQNLAAENWVLSLYDL